MTDVCDQPRAPLDAASLRALAVLMAAHDQAADTAAIADQVGRLQAPGFATDAERVADTVAALVDEGYLAAEGDGWRATETGRAIARELGGRAPGQACDATRTCLLLSLCLSGTMPAQNRRALVMALLGVRSGPALD